MAKEAGENWTAPKRDRPWLTDEPNSVDQNTKDGSWIIVWESFPPAGWTYAVSVKVDKRGRAIVLKAKASFPSR